MSTRNRKHSSLLSIAFFLSITSITFSLALLPSVSMGQDAELNPIEIQGQFSLNGEVLRNVTIRAYGVDGGNALTTALPDPAGDKTTIDYSIIVNVPAGGTKDYEIQACSATVESEDTNTLCFDKEPITVTDGVAATHDMHYTPSYIEGTITVTDDALSYFDLQGSYYHPSGGYLMSPYIPNRHFRAYGYQSEAVESRPFRVVVPHGDGEVKILVNLDESGARPTAKIAFDLAEGETMEWNPELSPPPGFIFGTITSTGSEVITRHNFYAGNSDNNGYANTTSNGPYEIKYLPDGTYSVSASTQFEGGAQYYYGSSQYSPSRSATIADGGSAEINIASTQALINGAIALTESASNDDLISLRPTFIGASGEVQGSQAIDNDVPLPSGEFEAVASPGSWRFYRLIMRLARSGSTEDNNFSQYLSIFYSQRPELLFDVSAEEPTNFEKDLPLGKATVRLTVAGGGELRGPSIQINCSIYDDDGAHLASYSGNSRNPNQSSSPVEVGIVSFLAPESTCWVDAQANVEGSLTSFGRIEDIVIEPGSDVVVENQGPKATIDFPEPGAVLDTSPIDVTGLAWDDGEVASVSVNGIAATLGDPNGEGKIPFTVSVPLEAGENLIELLVIDDTEKQFQSSRTVTYEGSTDTEPPIVTAPDDVMALATGELTPVDLGEATATDAQDGDLEATPDNQGPFPVGETVVTWSAMDTAGNTGTDNQLVTVIEPYPFMGFLPPISNPPAVNRAKAGQSIPVKFKIPQAEGFERDLDTVSNLMLSEASCNDMEPDGSSEYLDLDASPGLKFSRKSGRYNYRWQTDRSLEGCYVLSLTLDDGSVHQAYFNFR